MSSRPTRRSVWTEEGRGEKGQKESGRQPGTKLWIALGHDGELEHEEKPSDYLKKNKSPDYINVEF